MVFLVGVLNGGKLFLNHNSCGKFYWVKNDMAVKLSFLKQNHQILLSNIYMSMYVCICVPHNKLWMIKAWHSTVCQSSVFTDLTQTEWKHHKIFSTLHGIVSYEQYSFLQDMTKSKTSIKLILMGHYTTFLKKM